MASRLATSNGTISKEYPSVDGELARPVPTAQTCYVDRIKEEQEAGMKTVIDESLFLPPDTPFVLTAKEIAAILRVDVRTIQREAARGKLVGYYVGSELRFTRPAVVQYMIQNPASKTAPVFIKPPSRAGRKRREGTGKN